MELSLEADRVAAPGLARRVLESLYDGAVWLAALSMIGLLAMVLLSIVSRQVGFNVAGVDAYAGYCMASAGFLALAHTLKRNEHIRVTLVLARMKSSGARHALELWALGAATAIAALFAWFSVRLVLVSHQIHDVSSGQDATPMWIPQLSMAVGAAILFIAFADEWILEIRGLRGEVTSAESLRNE